ncbi:uncharacterized protein LOC131679503 [Topomyia yanbarensis]|uniref:uncharacterized protein LOC131679503 n=1 Tax=Topomyia yanbarensis TaxID=2498891 RepID=UPI00273B6D16|nr:uncharacterized protein LOC131679503 [Topomyia yanbarensis]
MAALDPHQRVFAEKAINDILFEATLGNLSKEHRNPTISPTPVVYSAIRKRNSTPAREEADCYGPEKNCAMASQSPTLHGAFFSAKTPQNSPPYNEETLHDRSINIGKTLDVLNSSVGCATSPCRSDSFYEPPGLSILAESASSTSLATGEPFRDVNITVSPKPEDTSGAVQPQLGVPNVREFEPHCSTSVHLANATLPTIKTQDPLQSQLNVSSIYSDLKAYQNDSNVALPVTEQTLESMQSQLVYQFVPNSCVEHPSTTENTPEPLPLQLNVPTVYQSFPHGTAQKLYAYDITGNIQGPSPPSSDLIYYFSNFME